jgi:hypothetical protein
VTFAHPRLQDSPPSSDNEGEEQSTGDRLQSAFLRLKARYHMTERCAEAVWDFMIDNSEEIEAVRQDTGFLRYKAIRRSAKLSQTQPKLDIGVTKRVAPPGDDEQFLLEGLDAFPRKYFRERSDLCVEWEITYLTIEQIVAIYKKLHKGRRTLSKRVVLGFDGVALDKSSGRSMQVLAIKFVDCGVVWPIVHALPRPGFKVPADRIWKRAVDQLVQSNLQVVAVVADAPARAKILGIKMHGGYFACSVCTAKGKHINNHRPIVYPANTRNKPLRTMAQHEEILENIADLDEESRLGIKGRSPIEDLQLDLHSAVNIEWMHLIGLGIIKKLYFLTFRVPHTTHPVGSKVS